MRVLVVGAGALGGYFGGRLLEAGRDVTFLVRPRRAAQLAKTGLVIQSPAGNAQIAAPPTVMAETLRQPFDLILLSCKAYDLAAAADSFAPAVGPHTVILPFLNGMRHMEYLGERFGAAAVFGGVCVISATVDAEGHILHLSNFHRLSFGEQNGERTARAEAILAALSGARFQATLSTISMQEMWDKWVFIAAAAATNCLMRANFGDIAAAGALDYATRMLDECTAIAGAHGFVTAPSTLQMARGIFSMPGTKFAASMLSDIERGGPTEADHIVGDLLRRGESKGRTSALLEVAFAHLRAYEARRKREHGGTGRA